MIGSGATTGHRRPGNRRRCRAGHDAAALAHYPSIPQPNRNELADRLRQVDSFDEPTVHGVVRQQILLDQRVMTQRAIDEPDVEFAKSRRHRVRAYAARGLRLRHALHPANYRPWQQRLSVRARRRPIQCA